jgi:hypothetical protein
MTPRRGFRLLRETHSELRQALDLLAAQLKSNKPRPWKDAPVIASVVASLLIATRGLVARVLSNEASSKGSKSGPT